MGSTAVLSARDRILSLLDENSFVEIGALITKRSTDFNLNEKEVPGDGVIAGYGLIDGSMFTVRIKMLWAEQWVRCMQDR